MGGPGGGLGAGRYGKFSYPDGARTLQLRVGRQGNSGGSGNRNAVGSRGASSVTSWRTRWWSGERGWSGGGGGGGGALVSMTSPLVTTLSSWICCGGGGGGSLGRSGRSVVV